MMEMMACLKENDFDQSKCNKQVNAFKSCYQGHLVRWIVFFNLLGFKQQLYRLFCRKRWPRAVRRRTATNHSPDRRS